MWDIPSTCFYGLARNYTGAFVALWWGMITGKYVIYAPDGFLAWNDEKGRQDYTGKLEDAATFSISFARYMLRHHNVCILDTTGRLYTQAEILMD